MSNLILSGVIEITGPHGTGKTTLSLGCGAHPSKMIIFDNDINGRGRYDELRQSGTPIGSFIDLIAMRESIMNKNSGRYRDEEFYLAFDQLIDNTPSNQFDVAIVDTWPEIGKACRSYVEVNPKEFKDKFTGSSPMVVGQISAYGRMLEENLIAKMTTKFRLVILISHLKDEYRGNVATGGSIPQSSKTLDKVCSMRIWLRANPNSPVPIAVLVKRLNKMEYVEGEGLVPTNMFPRKITPQMGDKSIWNSIRRYMLNPIGDRLPLPDETPDQYELSILDGILTDEQQMIMKYNLQQLLNESNGANNSGGISGLFNGNQNKVEEVQLSLPELSLPDRIRQLKDEGLSSIAIKVKVSSEYKTDVTMTEVNEILNTERYK